MGHDCMFEYEGPSELKARIERALRWVRHPRLGVNVLDAGLVLGVRVDAHSVRVRMVTTRPDCPLADVLCEDVEAELFDHLGSARLLQVQMLRSPYWSPARMKVVPIDQRLDPCPCESTPTGLTGIRLRCSPAA